jgi:hypothetical protein
MGGVAPRPARIDSRRADQLDPFVQGDTGVNEFSRAAVIRAAAFYGAKRRSRNEKCPAGSGGAFLSCDPHCSWRWRELNPRPALLREGFSGRSPLCPYSAPPVSRTRWCDRPSRCELSLKIPRPDLSVIPLADARIRVGGTPGLTDSLLAQRARAKSR